MRRKLEILHLEDNSFDAEIIQAQLKAEEPLAAISNARSRAEFEAALARASYDLILSDYSIPGFNGLDALSLARTVLPETPFIFCSGTIGEERAVEALRLGAADYVIKDRPARLVTAIRRALDDADAARERLQAAEQIREQALLLDQAQDAICLLDMSRTILYWNRSAARLYGWTVREALGWNIDELLFPDDGATSSAALKDLIEHGDWRGEVVHLGKGGAQLTVESRWTLVRDSQDEPKSILVINSDVTEKKQMEAQLQRAQRLESIGALASGIAHDLNNCLTPVLLGINMIEREVKSPASSKMLEIMRGSTQRGVDMIRQILAFARGAGGEFTALDLRSVIRDVVRLAEQTFPAFLEIKSNVATDLAPVWGNATQLHQVLLNLCVNARDAMPAGGCLKIVAADLNLDESAAGARQLRPGQYVRLTVSDTGQGMPPETVRQIFEPFFTTKGHGKGTGLGLSTAKGIVEAHAGSIEAASEPGQGAEFTVYLPAGRQLAGLPARNAPEMTAGRGELVLLVDDEAAVVEVTRVLLESFGYNVITARNGEEALSLYRQHPAGIDVVITDMMMPSMNGRETITALREIDPSARIIGISGMAAGTPLAEAARSLANAFLKKPFTTSELLVALKHVLSARAA